MSTEYPTNNAEFRICVIAKFERMFAEQRGIREAFKSELDSVRREGDAHAGRLSLLETEHTSFREKMGSLTGKVLMLTLFVSLIIAGLSAWMR